MIIALSIISILLLFTFLIELNAASRLRKRNEKQEEEIKIISNLKEKELEAYFGAKSEKLRSDLQKLQDSNTQLARHIENELNQFKQIQEAEEKATNQLQQLRNDLQKYKDIGYKKADEELGRYRNLKQTHLEHELEVEISTKRQEREKEFSDFIDELVKKKLAAEDELKAVEEELKEERTRRAAINEEIRKAEEKEKYNETHSVQLSDDEKEDIHFLLSLEHRIHNKQILYKLIWSTYLQRAYKNTFHNILGNRDPKNVIYCIENISNGKKYIGKTSAEVSKRWTEHIKTSLNIGTTKTTNIHKALYNHWDEFIFYIITETEKDKLSEMEKYYINFYESDKYGYNIKTGG